MGGFGRRKSQASKTTKPQLQNEIVALCFSHPIILLSLNLNGFICPRRFVNLRDQLHITQTFFSRRHRLFVVHYAVRHVVHLQREVVSHRKADLFGKIIAMNVKPQTVVRGSGIQLVPAVVHTTRIYFAKSNRSWMCNWRARRLGNATGS